MATSIRDSSGQVLAVKNGVGDWKCSSCNVWVQRTADGDIRDGVLAHYKTVHPNLIRSTEPGAT